MVLSDLIFPVPGLEMVYVETGKEPFMMGDNKGMFEDEKPEHPVVISPFYIGKFQVTQGLYESFMKQNPSSFKGVNRPVEMVSWEDTKAFLAILNKTKAVLDFLKENGLQDFYFRLSREAEWEYAAKGGIYQQGLLYAGSDNLNQVGWCKENSSSETKDVGQLLPNELGLYDMSGNIYEWCEDWYEENYYSACLTKGRVVDPKGPSRGVYRVFRGGGYFNGNQNCRSVIRLRNQSGIQFHYVGFRLVLGLQSIG